ncbi:hypothetical protein Bbelb_425040 [Branchiostoma belcheri]|nr:hypothetical protein Bbelb_425040 [Branchiostoma belcheri]
MHVSKLLCEHYSTEISREEVLSENQVLEVLLQQQYNDLNTNEVLQKVRLVHADTLPNMARLAAAILVVPVSTADCERGFSTMKRVKTCLRNRLKAVTLNNLLMISIEGPEAEEFDFDSACDKWASMCKRRLSVTTSM